MGVYVGRFPSGFTHSGTIRLPTPTPKPTTVRPITILPTLPARACHRAPRMKRTSATQMTPLRPMRSASNPANRPPTNAPSDVEDVIRDLSHVVTGFSGVESDGPRCSSAAEMEAVSSAGRQSCQLRCIAVEVGSLYTHSRTAGHLCQLSR